MGNVWGGSESSPIPIAAAPASDTVCNAGSATTVVTSGTIASPTPGNYIPVLDGVLAILLGATAPTALVISFILGAGSLVDSYTVPPAVLVNNATLMVNVALVGANSGSAWGGSGIAINVQVNPTTQNVTVKQVGSRVIFQLYRGIDA